jgi:hypothetical protein
VIGPTRPRIKGRLCRPRRPRSHLVLPYQGRRRMSLSRVSARQIPSFGTARSSSSKTSLTTAGKANSTSESVPWLTAGSPCSVSTYELTESSSVSMIHGFSIALTHRRFCGSFRSRRARMQSCRQRVSRFRVTGQSRLDRATRFFRF